MLSAGSFFSGDSFGSWLNDVTGTTATQNFNASEAEKDRTFQANEAQKQRDYELEMSSTSYQRAVEDMKNAGLNPASLSTGAMSGASTPQGSSASGSRASSSNNGAGALSALASFFSSVAKLSAGSK